MSIQELIQYIQSANKIISIIVENDVMFGGGVSLRKSQSVILHWGDLRQ